MHFRFTLFLAFIMLVAGGGYTSAPAQSPRTSPVEISRLEGEITLDGVPDEAAWQGLEPYPLTTYVPEAGNEPSQRTDVRVGYTDAYLYVGARLYDSEPGEIRVTSYKRDYIGRGSSLFGIMLDTFNNNETALAFFTSPAGIRTDFSIINDAEGRPPFNSDWNTFWDVETRQGAEGWSVEMRIPLSSLRYQVRDGKVTMGMSLLRWIARESEGSVYPARPNDWGFWGQFKPSQAQDVAISGVESSSPLQITPYVLGGASQEHSLNQAGTAWVREDDFTWDLGGDLKVGLSSNFTLDLTLNTDFAQVEADNQQVNLTRFSLFFPEKRKFFQERSSLFEFQLGYRSRLFYSRRIGINNGMQIPILGGLRLTGTAGEWDVGVMNMQTGAKGSVPTENFGVVRLRRKVFNPNSYAGGIFTSRLDFDGGYNYAYGLDGVFHLGGETYAGYNLAQTLDSGYDNEPLSLDPTFLRLEWETRNVEGFGYNLEYIRSGKNFEPGVGFLTRDNFTQVGDNIYYGWFAGEDSPVMNYRIQLTARGFIRNEDGSMESGSLNPQIDVSFNSGASINAGPSMEYEHLQSDFNLLGEITIPAGEYTFYKFSGRYNTTSSKDLTARGSFELGEFYDGYRWSWDVSPSWSISPQLNLGGYYEINRLNFPDRGQDFTAHVARLRLEYYFSTELSVSTFAQYSNAAGRITSNFRLRYNPREGNDLYLVYNEGLNTDRRRELPVRPLSQQRTILLKYNYTFNY